MAPLGPFESRPRVAVAVSGGADSMALAWLAYGWAADRGGDVRALVVDHRLRPESAAEAAVTVQRLTDIGIAALVLSIDGLAPGAGLAERAREARFAALEACCAAERCLHLLLGHHAADQAETVALRMLGHSGGDGLAGMAGLVERRFLRLLRPLLALPPVRLRATLVAAEVSWVEDPSNRSPLALRNRLRLLRADSDGTGLVTRAAVAAAAMRARQRHGAEAARAAWLAQRAAIHPEGFAVVTSGPIDAEAFAGLLRAIAGRAFPARHDQVIGWAAAARPATLAGCEIRPAGRLAPGAWLVLREAAAMQAAIPARDGATWDGRFRVAGAVPQGTTLGPLGADAAGLRARSPLPAAVLRTLPALRRHGALFAVPHLGYAANREALSARLICDPALPAAGTGFTGGGTQEFG
ncbi:MAG: tRNA lysidine(34) synthetase TilS [Alphaproteobacteria bacterium]|nr:tRNA lysidine(34) synthetase TilS [Alphaproteobacteria bacterium]